MKQSSKTLKAGSLAKTKPAKTSRQLPAIVAAAERGDAAEARKLIRSGADVNETTTPTLPPYYGADALIVAARHGRAEIVELLLANGARISNRSAYGSAVQQAIDYGHPEVVQLLLKHGARELGLSLFNALNQNRVDIFKAVAEAGISFDCFRDRLTRLSLLERAIHLKNIQVATLLLKNGIKLAGGELVECAAYGSADLARKLVERGADPKLPNGNGRYALSSACYWGNRDVAEVLLAHGASLTAQDVRGWSCLDWARYGKRAAMVKWLNSIAKVQGTKIPSQRSLKRALP
ncbi:MAG: ankyrin repeat domain-containing protein [Verrucomicrobia bacterium]|nr:MAG: ankyrin repeat domain-containing protein [Verrucomicrobiota bacterium]